MNFETKNGLRVPEGLDLRHFEFILTEDCNFKCTYCFEDYFEGRACKKESMLNEQDIDKFVEFIGKTYDPSRDPLSIFFIGGEPLMNFKGLKYAVEKLEKYYPPHVEYSMTTNFSLYNRGIGEFLIDHNVGVMVSLDGSPEGNKSRVFSDKSPTWKVVVNNILEYSDLRRSMGIHIPLAVHIVISKDNLYTVSNATKILGRMKDYINLSHNIVFEDDFTEEDKEEMSRVFKDILEITPHSGLARMSTQRGKKFYCLDPMRSVTLNKEGKLYFCHRFAPKLSKDTSLTSFGDIEKGYDEVLFPEWYERATRHPSGCQACAIHETCLGGCVAAQYFKEGNSLKSVNTNICNIYKELNKVATNQGCNLC